MYHISQISRHVALIQLSLSACSIPDLESPLPSPIPHRLSPGIYYLACTPQASDSAFKRFSSRTEDSDDNAARQEMMPSHPIAVGWALIGKSHVTSRRWEHYVFKGEDWKNNFERKTRAPLHFIWEERKVHCYSTSQPGNRTQSSFKLESKIQYLHIKSVCQTPDALEAHIHLQTSLAKTFLKKTRKETKK